MRTFSSLGELGKWAAASTPVRVVDPGLPLTAIGQQVNAEGWERQPAVRKVTSFIARLIAPIPLKLYEWKSDTHREMVSDHELVQVLLDPTGNPMETPFRFWQRVLLDGLIYDRWCVVKTRDATGRLRLTRIPARRTVFVADGLDRLDHIESWTADGRKMVFPAQDVIADAGYATNGAGGTSPLETLRELLNESAESLAYRRQIWGQGMRSPAVIEMPGTFKNDEQRTRFVQSMNAFVATGGRAGGVPVLENGATYKPLPPLNPQTAGDLDSRKLTSAEVASAYHIPPELVGDREGTYSNIDAFRQMLYRTSLGPYIAAWEQAVHAGLMSTADTNGRHLYVQAHMDAVLRGSVEEQARSGTTATGRPWLTTNEFRSRSNMPPVEGGDELITPLNVAVGGQMPGDAGVQNLKSALGGLIDEHLTARAVEGEA